MLNKSFFIKLSAAVLFSALLCSCGQIENNSGHNQKNDSVATSDEDLVLTLDESSDFCEPKPAECDVGDRGAKAVCHVKLIPKDNIDASEIVRFTDYFGVHVLHSGVVGLVGSPMGIDFPEDEIREASLEFTYNPEYLKGVRPDSLMFMWYDEENNNYVELDGETLDEQNSTVTIDIDKSGVYLLVNRYEWFNVWGANLADNGLESDYSAELDETASEVWSANCQTGDILKLADLDYIKNSISEYGTVDFHVSTPEQLASAVYFVNCLSDQYSSHTTIRLENDIDLDGLDWVPMGWYTAGVDFSFRGEIVGNGFTIKNMKITNAGYSYRAAGLVGFSSLLRVYDLNVEDAYISHSGSYAGIIMGEQDVSGSYFENCSVSGIIEASGGGAIAGHENDAVFENCRAKVIINGEKARTPSATQSEKRSAAEELGTPVEITIDENFVVTRPEGLENEYENIGWYVTFNGSRVLDRNAENETQFDYTEIYSEPGEYTVTLTAFYNGNYIPISNTVTYIIE